MSKYDPQRVPIDDPATQRQVNELIRAAKDMARDPVIDRHIFEITLASGVLTKVKHGLGRKPIFFVCGPVAGASATGRIVKSTPDDPSTEIWLTATGFGATVTCTLLVF